MGSNGSSQREVTSILVIAADPNIESLVAELIAFAGHRPLHDPTCGAAGESIRRTRPRAVLIDTALPTSVVAACLRASDEVGSHAILISSTDSTAELRQDARARGLLYFALPGGPKPLAKILERAFATETPRSVTAIPERRRTVRTEGPIYPALCAALASVARARTLSLRAQSVVRAHRADDAREAIADETRRGQQALRAVIVDYARQLKAASLPMDKVLVAVNDSISECATAVGAEPAIPALLLDAEQWTRDAYCAA